MAEGKSKILGSTLEASLLLAEQVGIEPHLSRADNTMGAVAAPVPNVLIPGIPSGFQSDYPSITEVSATIKF